MDRYIISERTTIKDSLVVLNQISSDIQSLLVVDDELKLVGTLTDGDIRRGLISGAELSDSVRTIMHKDFKFILKSKFDVSLLKDFRDKRILFIPVLDEENHILEVLNLKKMKSSLPIDAILMAGGKGERLRPLTEKTPKPLVKVGEKCIIDYNVERLISYGIKHINVTINYLGEQLERHFSTPINNIEVNCVREPKYLGTIGSIQFVQKIYNDTILVMNSDLFTNINYEDFYIHFKEHDADMSVAVVPYNVNIPFGIFELEGRKVIGIKEKPIYHHYANAGIYLMKKNILKHIPKDSFFNATDLIEELIKRQMSVIRFPITGYWIDIGQYSELERAQELVKHLY